MTASLSLFAPAKVNLFLHVLARRTDGYHDLESLIVFVDVGDRLTVAPAEDVALSLEGPFAPALVGEPVTDNLVYRAASLLRDQAGPDKAVKGAALRLDKRLPVASGIGGGSADAAAALRLLLAHWDMDLPRDTLQDLGLSLGADIPVCLDSSPSFVSGIGETLRATPPLPDTWMVLVNSGTPVPTGPVFKGLDPATFTGEPGPTVAPDAFARAEDFLHALQATRNDLEVSAVTVAPDIQDVLKAISATSDCGLARMSGSGGTCFGLYTDQHAAEAAVARLRADHAGWWVASGKLLQAAPPVTVP